MFRLHQSVRRRLCQAGFCLFCLLPTAAMFGWSMSRKLPSHVRRCEQRLSEQLGLTVQLDSVSYPRPGMCLFEGLELADPETGQSVFRCRLLEVSRSDDALVLMASETVLEVDRMDRLWELLGRRLRRELGNRENLVLLPCHATFVSAREEQTYELLDGRIEPGDRGETAELRFRLAGVEMPEPASISVVRNQQHQPPSTRIALHTGNAPLPCSLFAPLCDVQTTLGSRATFTGSLWADDAKEGWEAEIAGRFDEIDLRQLVSARFPHVLDGSAAVEFSGARLRHNRLIEAYGTLQAGPGTIGRTLLAGAVDALDCASATTRWSAGAQTYEQLAFNFSVNHEGLALAGVCQGQAPGVVLVAGDGRPLLAKTGDDVQPVINLLRLLVPASEVLVPATQETGKLIPWLPTPPIALPVQADGLPAPPAVVPRVGGVR